ncbi:MAG: Ldh family oxidoreductase [Planctomycetales bacterium]|nr:Ldh family oxidoreductase [Planctomycetales bacterium]
MPNFSPSELQQFIADVCRAVGANQRDADIVANHLVDANLAGHDSHGVMRIVQYVEEVRSGKIVPDQSARRLEQWDNGAVVDASGAFGQVACHEAMQMAIQLASEASLAAVTLRNCNHSGRLGTYAEMAAAAGVIGLVMGNAGGAGQWVAPFGGRERRLSTNPLAFGAPSGGDFPFVLDISTSVVPEGKIRDYAQRGAALPDGWLVDATGAATRDANNLYAEPAGAILPLGGAAGHKGCGLAMMVDILAGALSGAGCSRAGGFDPLHGSGLFMMAISGERFGTADELAAHVAELIAYVVSSEPAEGFERVIVPGQYEHEQRLIRRERGIDVPSTVWQQMRAIAKRIRQDNPQLSIRIPQAQENTT